MADLEVTDFFTSGSLLADPYPYYDELRERCPVQREPHHGVVMVTGYDEALAVYHDTERFSSCTAVTGPFPGFPVPLEGDDVSELIEQHRDELPFSDQLPTFDPPKHTVHRGLLMRLLTPGRLKENEDSMWQLADRQLDEFVGDGRCEFVGDYAGPFAMLVIADLLGVPEEDHDDFRRGLGQTEGLRQHEWRHARRTRRSSSSTTAFTAYVEDRRRSPRDDVLTRLAQATYKDGSTPEVLDVVRLAANLFAAGQETTVRMLAAAVQMIAEDADLQQRLRERRELIPNFVEEVLRFESPVKGDFRLARVLDHGRGRRHPGRHHRHGPQRRRQPRPPPLRAARRLPPRPRERPRAPRVRARHPLLPRAPRWPEPRDGSASNGCSTGCSTSGSREAEHGPPGARRYRYFPTYILRGLQRLHVEFTPA